MGIKNQLEENLKTAMKAHDEDRKNVIRLALASIKFAEKEQNKALAEDEVNAILQKEVKIRREMIEDAKKAGREDTIDGIIKEAAILEEFLPKQLSIDEIKQIVAETAKEVEAVNPADMGKVMKAIMPKVKGIAASDVVSKCVKEYLADQ
jgi:hypothetical protein